MTISPDPLRAWWEAHPEDVRRYAGQRVAWHPRFGIVAAAPTLAILIERTKNYGVLLKDVVFDVAPAHPNL